MHALSALVLSLPLVLAANHQNGPSHRRHARNPAIRAKTYTLTDKYQGDNFFDGWEFFSGADPTHGNVQFVDQKTAMSDGLAYVQSDGTVSLDVDTKADVPVGGTRNSVRISTKKSYNSGLFVADFFAMPHGCGVWPAWWSSGPNWPNAGEIDVIEGVNDQQTNQYTLHTGGASGCKLDVNASALATSAANATGAFTGHPLGTDCLSSNGNNAGCAVSDTDARSFGHGFNTAYGGVFAHLWDATGIAMWHFARDDIPPDVAAGSPDPSTWPTPSALFSSAACDIGANFFEHTLVLDTTICGDWAGPAYEGSGCPGTCAEAVANASNFNVAKWKINYIAVYN